MTAASGDLPLFVVVRGTPTDEEVAALTAVFAARSRASAAASPLASTRPSQWSSKARAMRQPHRPGPGAWRASAWGTGVWRG